MVSSFCVKNIEVPASVNAPAFGLVFRGLIDVPKDGVYSFFLTCYDGGVLKIGKQMVVDNDGNHAAQERTGQLVLKKGAHPLELDFIEGGGAGTLKLKYSFNGSVLQEVPAGWLKN